MRAASKVGLVAALASAALMGLGSPSPAEAHPLPQSAIVIGHPVGWSIHKALCKVSIGKCRDLPPRPGPQTPCPQEVQIGTIEVIFDKRLGGYVEWICTADGWRRTGKIVPAVNVPWSPPETRRVMDWHRLCKSVVCKRRLIAHYYATKWLVAR